MMSKAEEPILRGDGEGAELYRTAGAAGEVLT